MALKDDSYGEGGLAFINKTKFTGVSKTGYERLTDAILAQTLQDCKMSTEVHNPRERVYRNDAIAWVKCKNRWFLAICDWCRQDPDVIHEAVFKKILKKEKYQED